MKKKQEFHVDIRHISYGFVRIMATSKNEAKEVVSNMNKKRLLDFYKEKCHFLNIGDVFEPEND